MGSSRFSCWQVQAWDLGSATQVIDSEGPGVSKLGEQGSLSSAVVEGPVASSMTGGLIERWLWRPFWRVWFKLSPDEWEWGKHGKKLGRRILGLGTSKCSVRSPELKKTEETLNQPRGKAQWWLKNYRYDSQAKDGDQPAFISLTEKEEIRK